MDSEKENKPESGANPESKHISLSQHYYSIGISAFPSPEELEKYKQIDENLLWEIIYYFKQEQTYRHHSIEQGNANDAKALDNEHELHKKNFILKIFGLVSATLVSLVFIVLGCLLIFYHHSIIGTFLAIFPATAVVAFIKYSSADRNQDRGQSTT